MSNKRVTSKEVLQYVYKLLKASPLYESHWMEVYYYGTEPRETLNPGIVIRHVAGSSGEIQEGVVSILIYSTANGSDYGSGIDKERLESTTKIERKAQDWVESLPTGEYLFWSDDTVQTDYDPEAGLYFTSIRLKYRHY